MSKKYEQTPMDELVDLALRTASKDIFYDWNYKEHREGWDTVLGVVLAEIDRREIKPLLKRVDDLEKQLKQVKGTVRRVA